jgi:hypothetical protein
LQSLRVAWSSNLTDQGVSYLPALSHLSELDLSLTGITARSCQALHPMMQHLRVLDLSATEITKQGLTHLFSGPPTSSISITRLTLRFLEDLTSEQVEEILLASSLELLDVTHSGIEGGNIQVHPLLWHAIGRRCILTKGVAPKASTKQEPLIPST